MKISHKLYFAFMLTIFQFSAIGQGLILDDVGYDTTPRLPLFGGQKGLNTLPTAQKLSFRPTPDDQGNSVACTAFACGYGAYSMLQAMRKNEGIGKNLFSPAFVFNQTCTDPRGASLKIVLDFICKNGDCLKSTFPNSCIAQKTPPPTFRTSRKTRSILRNRTTGTRSSVISIE